MTKASSLALKKRLVMIKYKRIGRRDAQKLHKWLRTIALVNPFFLVSVFERELIPDFSLRLVQEAVFEFLGANTQGAQNHTPTQIQHCPRGTARPAVQRCCKSVTVLSISGCPDLRS